MDWLSPQYRLALSSVHGLASSSDGGVSGVVQPLLDSVYALEPHVLGVNLLSSDEMLPRDEASEAVDGDRWL